MESATVERFKTSTDHDDELSDYTAMAYIPCIGDMIRLMTKKGTEAAIPVLTKAKNSYSTGVA